MDREERLHLKDQHQAGETRNAFERDRDRILYSYEFRRLSGVSQVAAAGETHLLHNRLTHSLKVGQIARRLAQRLNQQAADDNEVAAALDAMGGVDPDVVEAAGMAHDLGHPPFGHVAEHLLDELLAPYGGYEGNAQTFRLVTKLAVRKHGLRGLDLTAATLNAILKYPRVRQLGSSSEEDLSIPDDWLLRHHYSKSGVYESERRDFNRAREAIPEANRSLRQPESILIDWADDVSYAVHDVEDFFRAGLIPLQDLNVDKSRFHARAVAKLSRKKGPSFSETEFADALDRLMDQKITLTRPFYDEAEDLGALHRFASDRITDYEKAVKVIDYPPYIHIDKKMQYEVLVLMELTWYYVIDRPALASVQEGQKRMVSDVFDTLIAWSFEDREHPRLPRRLKDLIGASESDEEGDRRAAATLTPAHSDEYHFRRAAADYIASLTEPQMYDLHGRLSGRSSYSVFGTWF